MTPAQLTGIIRFHLNEMGARNAHHEFEHLARHLARARVHSNILPATGPVSAGGDGGKDFETFSTSVVPPLAATKGFSALSSGARKVAFSCSIQQDAIVSKIKADVHKVVSTGSVDEIVYFCTSNVPVGKRHELQEWARDSHSVELQLFDGGAIAEMLGDRDVFWIAQEYLNIPAECMPAPQDGASWYHSLRDRWRDRIPILVSASDFAEIKTGLRRATYHEEARPDLDLWLSRMGAFDSATAPRHLQRNAEYEIAVAWLRAKQDMTGQLSRLRDYFSDIEDWQNLADLENAATLVSFAVGGFGLQHLLIDGAELFQWRDIVMNCIDECLAIAPGPGSRAGLYRIKGNLSVIPSTLDTPASKDASFESWNKMLDEAEHTTQFPIEDFADYLAKITLVISGDDRFFALTERVDALLSRRSGPIVAAERLFDRGMTFYQADELPQAIHELHRAQFRWFSDDSMPDFQRATFLLANSYLELGFCYSAKYVALAAAFNAHLSKHYEVTRTLPRLLFTAASADYAAGNFISYLQDIPIAIAAHCVQQPDPFDLDQHTELREHLSQIAAIRALSLKVGEPLSGAVAMLLARWPVELRESIEVSSDDPNGSFSKDSWEDLWAGLERNLLGRPFCDSGHTRQIIWRAFDVTWRVTFDNNYSVVPIGEEFVAALQTTLAALAGVDLCLVPTTANLTLSVESDATQVSVSEVQASSTGDVDISIVLAGHTMAERPEGAAAEVPSLMVALLRAFSVLPEPELVEVLEPLIRDIAGRLFVGRAYRELYREFYDADAFAEDTRRDTLPLRPNIPFAVDQNEHLSPLDVEGPTYSKSVSLDSIAKRYERASQSVPITIRNLMSDASTCQLLCAWHNGGALDWEIAAIITSAAVNVRYPPPDNIIVTKDVIDRYLSAMSEPEGSTLALGAAEMDEEMLESSKISWRAAHLSSWGLQMCPAAQNPEALEAFLIHRYGLRSDDVPHPDLFGW